MGAESPGVLAIRAALYEWLTMKFGSAVELEKQDCRRSFPRPIDCWVNRDRGAFGYVVLGRGLKSSVREHLLSALHSARVSTTFVFHIDTLVLSAVGEECLVLSTTQRAFASNSKYSECRDSCGLACLHFLDPALNTLTTFRGLGIVHSPHVYRGVRLTTPLSEILVSPKNGEFVHPGEPEAWRQWHARQSAGAHNSVVSDPLKQWYAKESTSAFSGVISDPEAICSICGERTSDYWWYDGQNGICRCRKCQRAGRHSPNEGNGPR